MFRSHPFVRWINQRSPVQILIFFYFIAIVFSTILLSLPIAFQKDVHIPFIDILFTAVSAFSVTGLSTINVAETLSTTGIIFLGIILQIGAVGVMAIGTLLWIALGKKIGIRERRLIMTDQNQTTFEGMVRLIIQIIYILLIIEFVFFLILGFYYLRYFPTFQEAFLHSFFGTISAITNAGFDITGESLHLFNQDYFVQIVYVLLIIFGAIGFPVLIEVKEFLFAKRENRKHMRFSLFTKVTTVTFFLLVFIGTIVIYILDMNHYFASKTWHESFFNSLFQSVTTRSAGLSTIDVSLLTEQNQFFMSMLMFIGASPSSAGGGIRTTTFALVIIFIITYAKGGKSIRLFKREVYEEDLLKAVTVTLMAFIFVALSLLVTIIIEPFSIMQLLFEVTSAFGTVGLSLGITGELTTFSKIILMILMFIGRIGILTFLFSFKTRKSKGKIHYPKEKMIIG